MSIIWRLEASINNTVKPWFNGSGSVRPLLIDLARRVFRKAGRLD